jgi:Domain of unknown function (DUF4279)
MTISAMTISDKAQPVIRVRATLVIASSTMSVEEALGIVGIEPDWSNERGSPVTGSSGNLHKYTTVAFQSRIAPESPPSAHVDALLKRVASATHEIRSLAGAAVLPESRGVPVTFSLYLESSKSMVGVGLSAEQLRAIAELGAHFGVEVAVDEGFAQE